MKIQLLLEVVNDMRSLADGLEALAQAIAAGDNQPVAAPPERKPAVTHEMLRELAVRLSRNGKREDVKRLIERYGVKNITAVADADLESFYAELSAMEVV